MCGFSFKKSIIKKIKLNQNLGLCINNIQWLFDYIIDLVKIFYIMDYKYKYNNRVK